ncbi:hypothetical protein [Paenibacillus radicis (ex Gao et al. 2016)]|uniref:Uncharacterized protein n=1 Tax=Paenibacillus radicis (ex Gao et al. 2016) TaxID=1737354 RepID=A0A917HLV8_9BACL|nr:hypothetical protein [Paenibacillus radicis (ex Gao et al. 2016)]GGG82951.1 hypothetical protein GCM10010918_45600 [Paenibacillus radicis (ex Gao et al. 2016)]
MNAQQLMKIVQDQKKEVIIDGDVIKEKTNEFENFYQLIKNNGVWEFSEMNFERKPSPEKQDEIIFLDESKAINYFFIRVYKKLVFTTVFSANNPIYEISDINALQQLFDKLGITSEYYSFQTIKPQIVFGEADRDQLIISYIDRNQQKRFTTNRLKLERGVFVMYRLTYSLYLLKSLEDRMMKEHVLIDRFHDDEIELFLK